MVSYFDLEGFPGVAELRRVKDANSEPISIPLGLLFGDQILTTAYVRYTMSLLLLRIIKLPLLHQIQMTTFEVGRFSVDDVQHALTIGSALAESVG